MQPILPVVSSPRVLLSSTARPSRKQTTNRPQVASKQYKQPSRARPSGTSLRSATSTFITQLTTEHSRSISTARGPLSVSYKGERERRGKTRITEPHPCSHQTGPRPNTQPQSLWSPKPQIPRLPWTTWAELAPRSPESRHATLTASLFRHFHPRPLGAALTLASLPRQPY